jgi:glycosyltransferase involved in cell wall biosynthesis
MRIIHVCSYYTEPLARGYQVYELAREQVSSGHEVHILTSNLEIALKEYQEVANKVNNPQSLDLKEQLSETGAIIHRLPRLFSIFGRNWWSGYKRALIKLKPDIIIAHNILEFQSIRLIYYKDKITCPVIFDDHTTQNIVRTDFFGKLFYCLFRTFYAKRIYKMALKIVGISESCIKVLEKHFGLAGQKVEMIGLGANTGIFYQDTSKREKYRKTAGIPDEAIILLYTGKINAEKQVHKIMDALEKLKDEKLPPIRVIIAGNVEESYRPTLDKSIEECRFPVTTTGIVPHSELAFFYNAADISVWPAHTTTSTLDASACGCPIICSDYKKERYKYNNGIGIKEGDVQELSAALKTLIFDESLRKEMGMNGIRLINDEYSWKKVNEEFLKSN